MAFVFAVLFMMFVTSCDDNKKTDENLPDSEVTDEDTDEPADTETDTGSDSGTDTGSDTGSDTGTDTGSDTGTDTGSDTGTDTGSDTGTDTGSDTGSDTGDSTPDEGDSTPDEGDSTPDEGDSTPDEGDSTPDEGDSTPDEGDSTPDEGDSGDDADSIIDEGDTECTVISNGSFSEWEDGKPVDWVIRNDKGAFHKKVSSDGGYALNVYVQNPAEQLQNSYAFETADFTTAADAAIPTKITFDLKTNKQSKMSINLRYGPDNNDYIGYNWDSTTKSFTNDNDGMNQYRAVNLSTSTQVSIVFGDEITKEFWQNHEFSLEFKYYKKSDFDITVDNFVLHTAAGACEPEEAPIYTVSWAETRSPQYSEVNLNDSQTFYGRVLVAGITDLTPGVSEATSVMAKFGIKADDETDYTWYNASVNEASNPDFGNNDEFKYDYTFTKAGTYTYYFKFSADGGEPWTEAVPDPLYTVTVKSTTPSYEIGYATVQWPNTDQTLEIGEELTVFGQVYVSGLTDTDNGGCTEKEQLTAQIGVISSTDADYEWTNATVNTACSLGESDKNNDEFQSTLSFDTAGTYTVVYRFSVDGGVNWAYSTDFNNIKQIKITVNPADEPDSGDTEPDTGDTEPDTGDTEPDTGDTEPDTGDTEPDTGDTEPDTGDTEPDTGDTEPTYEIGYATVQWPNTDQTLNIWEPLTVYGRVYVAGITDATPNESVETLIKAQLCAQEKNAENPTCYDATVNSENHDSGNDDEFQYRVAFAEAGEYTVTYRFSVDDGENWVSSTDFNNIQQITITVSDCLSFPNGDFSDFSGINDIAGRNWQIDSVATYSNVDGALNVAISSQTSNGTAFDSAKFVTSSDCEVPAGIKFKLATIKSSKVAISFHWGTGGNGVFYAYNWDGNGNFVYDAKKPTTYNYDNPIDFGDTEMKEVTIIFGTEITEEIWHKSADKFIRFKYGKNADYEIRVDDFEFVYYGGTCDNAPSYTVGWATIQSPKSVEGYAGMTETFYGRVNIPGLTDTEQNWNKSVALMGVKAQFCIEPKDVDAVWECYDADPEISDTSVEPFGGNNEYKYAYKFNNAGDYEYTFKFSTDNGKNWTWIKDDGTWENSIHIAYATILTPEPDQIPNGDFKYWSGSDPQLWTVEDKSTFSKITIDENTSNYALKVERNNSSNGTAFNSPEFNTSADAKLPKELTFKLATDRSVKISIWLYCGGKNKQYPWNTTDGVFKNASNTYKAVDLGDTNMHDNVKIVFGNEITNDFWQGKKCYFQFKFAGDADKRWATFDDFQFVYPEDED